MRTEAERVAGRVAGYRAREGNDSDRWEIELAPSTRDGLDSGQVETVYSRVVLSRLHHPDPLEAEQTAYLMGIVCGRIPTSLRHTHQQALGAPLQAADTSLDPSPACDDEEPTDACLASPRA